MNIIMLGAQGTGKGTVAGMLKEELNIPHISTGEMFRNNIKEGTELGKIAEKGDKFSYENLDITIIETDSHRVNKIKVKVNEIEEEDDKKEDKKDKKDDKKEEK